MTVDTNIAIGNDSPRSERTERPPSTYVDSEFDKQLWSDLPVAAFCLSILYVLFALSHPFTVGGKTGLKLTALAGSSALILFLFGLWLRRSKTFHLANLTAAIFAAIVLCNSASHLVETRDPAQFTNFVVLVVAIGTFFLSWRWCVAALAVVGAVWGAALQFLGREHTAHYIFAFITSSVVAALAFRFRTHALRCSIVGAWSEHRHLAKLEAAEAQLILANTELEKRVAQRTAELHDQVEQKRKMEQAVLEAEKLATTGRMAAILAHEINNPLDTIVNCLHLLNNESLQSAARTYLELAIEELHRVVRITRHTLGFYRRGEKPETFDCSCVATEVVSAFAPLANERGVQLEARIQDSQVMSGFSGEIRQLLTNLIMNAMDAGGTIVRVRIFASHDRRDAERLGIRISVADNGKGVSHEHAPKVFEPFFTTKGEKGTGLGLWVCKGIVHKHNGAIAFRSLVLPLQRGSVFSAFLPSAHAQQAMLANNRDEVDSARASKNLFLGTRRDQLG
jgi:signal transduction histidine kinase